MFTGALVGFGEAARNGHWPGYRASVEARITAVVDRTDARRALARALDPAIATFASLDELGESMRVDFVDICTPPSLHADPMIAAIKRGWHVLCEKPFLIDPLSVESARRAAVTAGVAVLPVHNWKYAPIVAAATSALRAGAIGTLRRVRIDTARLREAATADPTRPNWRRDPAVSGGGILMDHGWHAVYLALHWFARPHTAVRGILRRDADGGVEDEAAITVDFPGGSADISLTWNGATRSNAMTLAGDQGEIVIDDDTLHVRGARSSTARFDRALSAGSHHDDWFAAMLPDVVACFRDPVRSRPLFEEAATCLSIIREAYRCDASLVAPPR